VIVPCQDIIIITSLITFLGCFVSYVLGFSRGAAFITKRTLEQINELNEWIKTCE
jgi:hypothetical protein